MEEQKNIARPFVVTSGTLELSRNIDDYPEGIILPIDKPYRWTSADVIRRLKYAAVRHFGRKNLKIGHAGTLDPLATGILIVCIGKATKLAQGLMGHDKEYVAGITFGATTPSYDLEKEIDREFPYEHITEALLREKLKGFIGEQEQVAPLFSAKSIDGVRAYEHARRLYKAQGNISQAESELIRIAHIHIYEAELLRFWPADGQVGAGVLGEGVGVQEDVRDVASGVSGSQPIGALQPSTAEYSDDAPSGASGRANATTPSGPSSRIHIASPSLRLPHADIRLACGKGTYVRAFARDLGEALGSGAHLSSLRRTASGPFTVASAVPLDVALSKLI